jgi:hypothetical protein
MAGRSGLLGFLGEGERERNEGGMAAEGEGPPPGGEEQEKKKLEYCKELSEEQLTDFYEKAADNEEAVR